MSRGIHLDLTRIRALLTALGEPHLSVPIIHVAGTNGKGSVCAYVDSILRTSGFRVGRFTSPHLTQVCDSISINGKTIEQHAYNKTQKQINSVNETNEIGASPFELLTAMAFEAFKREKPALDIAVIEVGMGGTADATNVCPCPLVSVITAVDLDHQAYLGDTVAEIAAVKAGIIKEGTPCILAQQAHAEVTGVVRAVTQKLGAPLFEAQPAVAAMTSLGLTSFPLGNKTLQVKVPLQGRYQLANAATAISAIDCLRSSNAMFRRITDEAIARGIEATKWPGRLQWIELEGRKILIDGAHNSASIRALRDYLDEYLHGPTTYILGLSAPRAPEAVLKLLLEHLAVPADVIAVGFSQPEGMPFVNHVSPNNIVEAVRAMGLPAKAAPSVKEALQLLESEGNIVICGSLYLIADVYRMLETANA